MYKKFKYLVLSLIVSVFVLGVGISSANANLTLGALTIASDGVLSLSSAATSNISIGSNLTTGEIILGGTLAMGSNNITSIGSIGTTGARLVKGWFTDLEVTNPIVGSITGNAGTVTNAVLSTALTVNTGTITLSGDVTNTSVLTIGPGTVSISGSNTGDNAANSSTMYIGTTAQTLNRTSASEELAGITGLTPGADFTLTQNSVIPLTSVETGAVANTLYLKTGNIGLGTTSPTNILSLGGNTARTIWLERNSVSDTAGNNLIIQSGGATASATNKSGGSLTLKSGLSTGNALPGDINLTTTITGISGTADQSYINKFMVHNKVYTMPDNTNVQIFSVNLPTANTGAAVHLSFTYNVTDGTNAGSHAGIFVCAFVNNAGTVSGSCADSGESVAGVSAGAGIDTETVTVVGTVATFEVKFNNAFGTSPNGIFTCQVLNNSATNFTWL